CHVVRTLANAVPADAKQHNSSCTTKLYALHTSSTNHRRPLTATTVPYTTLYQSEKIIEAQTMFHCYVLSSEKTGRRYVGSCENLADRIDRHNAGQSKATKHGVPWVLIRSESFASRSEAAQRELYYNTGRGRDEHN